MLWCEKTEEGIPAWLLFTPKPRLRTSCWIRAHRHRQWREVVSELVGSLQHLAMMDGLLQSLIRSRRLLLAFQSCLSQREGSGGCSREGGWPAGQSLLPAPACQHPPQGMLPCLSAKNIWGQQLPFSLLGMIQPYKFYFMQSKDELYLQVKHSSYFMFFCSGKIRDPTWWNLHCLKIQGLFTKNTFCWWQSSTP